MEDIDAILEDIDTTCQVILNAIVDAVAHDSYDSYIADIYIHTRDANYDATIGATDPATHNIIDSVIDELLKKVM